MRWPSMVITARESEIMTGLTISFLYFLDRISEPSSVERICSLLSGVGIRIFPNAAVGSMLKRLLKLVVHKRRAFVETPVGVYDARL